MAWFHYHQNNSGGFIERGTPHNLFVEAESARVAALAVILGIHWTTLGVKVLVLGVN